MTDIKPDKYDELWNAQKEAKRALDMHNKRRNILLTVTGGFFLIMMTSIISGFLINLGYGIIWANTLFAGFFAVSAFFTGLWVFDGWDAKLEEKYEETMDEFNKFMAGKG